MCDEQPEKSPRYNENNEKIEIYFLNRINWITEPDQLKRLI